eukprot:3667920-Rhodomonas_salina.3
MAMVSLKLQVQIRPPDCLLISPFGEVDWQVLLVLAVINLVQGCDLKQGGPGLPRELCDHHCMIQLALSEPVVGRPKDCPHLRGKPCPRLRSRLPEILVRSKSEMGKPPPRHLDCRRASEAGLSCVSLASNTTRTHVLVHPEPEPEPEPSS